jgi:hypothetical protein
MATSSIFTRVRIDNEKEAEAFVAALEKSEQATKDEVLSPSYPFLTDKEKIKALMAKRKKRS